MPFAPEYMQFVLSENFADAKRFFWSPLLAIHYAHLVMLAERQIVSAEDAHTLRGALDRAARANLDRTSFDGTFEDLFFYTERLILEGCRDTLADAGQPADAAPDVAGRLHTARSRNDIDMTMYRMRQREMLAAVLHASIALRTALLDLAAQHHETVFAAHTHTQRAQPTTLAHYLLAVAEQLERDAARLRAAYATTNRSPLGACAITGTGFPIDRERTATLLGFDAPTGNTYGSIATVDYVLESAGAVAVLLAGVGRVTQDLLLWSTAEFGFLRLGAGFVQCSSIMPQKRNPVALEHVRAVASKALGQSQAVFLAVHNTPFGDVVDTEDDFQPLVFSLFHDADRAVRLLAAALASAEFDTAVLEASTTRGWTTMTELADTLVRDHGLSFRSAHAVARRMIERCEREPRIPLAQVLAEAARAVEGREIHYSEAALSTILSARHFVAIRRTAGGPAPDVTREALTAARQAVAGDREWCERAESAIRRADRERALRAAEL